MTNGRTRRTGAGHRGLVLVAAVGILGVLAVMAMSFAAVMRLEARAARNFTNAVHAEFVARAGIEDAIARLRAIARDGSELPYEDGRPAAWYTWRGTAGGGWKTSFAANEATNCLDDDGDGLVDGRDSDERAEDELAYTDWISSTNFDGGDSYTLSVEDAASKINVNAGDNLGVMLDNLCRVIGPPLLAAEQGALMPKWFTRQQRQYATPLNANDNAMREDLFYELDADDRPVMLPNGRAVYGDGYAIAGWRARHGAFHSVEDVRAALTWVEREDGDGDGELECDTPDECMEVEAKLAAIRPYITIDSWADTDQIGYGKFEHVHVNAAGHAIRLVDRNRTWNRYRNDGEGELKGCYVAIVNGVGQGQFKTIARNTVDTIILDNSVYGGSEMVVPPTRDSSYIIVGRDHRYDASAEEWYNEARLYAKQPLSFHRAPVNVNTATDKVLVALTLGLQTNWGAAGYYTNEQVRALTADWHALCPSVLSVGRDGFNAELTFALPCPNDSELASRKRDPLLADHGHPRGGAPYCFFCNWGRGIDGGEPGKVSEAHYIAWQILKEREQTEQQDERSDTGRARYSNGYGPFRGWDDLYFRVFRPWERGSDRELNLKAVRLDADVPRVRPGSSVTAMITSGTTAGHPGSARLCMANFNSNTDILKFQPNLEWINRWGANFTDLYLPHPEVLGTGATSWDGPNVNRDLKLRVRPGELLDKSDLNVGTTEFTFDSGGVYEIESTGRIYDEVGVVAEKKFTALVRIYDVWRESTQREFVAGTIMDAKGAPGSAAAGQLAADGVSPSRPGGGPVRRKALCTYPEPVVPGTCKGADGGVAPLALDRRGVNVKPAGYDGQIMLATNSLMLDAGESPDGTVTFYNSFTGQLGADVARGDPKVLITSLDAVGLMGALDSEELDLNAVRDSGTGRIIEGEGRGGDLRPDGAYFGVVGTQHLDGSIAFESVGNMELMRGTISMWVKPNWHHGTMRPASLPLSYMANASREKGSHVTIRNYANWKSPYQRYTGDAQRDAMGYVRERFEHEFFNATYPGVHYAPRSFRFAKYGDEQNSVANSLNHPTEGALQAFKEPNNDSDTINVIPGFLNARTGKPYYRFCPFTWSFLGFTWNYSDAGGVKLDKSYYLGTPFEKGQREGVMISTGATYGQTSVPEATNDKNVTALLTGRLFVDTMHSFDLPLSRYGLDQTEALQAWSYDQYSNYASNSSLSQRSLMTDFGINKARPEGAHGYQLRNSGTYATIDELTISDSWKDLRSTGSQGLRWPQARRDSGRYYFDKTGRQRPTFTSQTLYSSERASSLKFTEGERDEIVELGTVRWTVFTPYYCIRSPGLSDYQFPYDTYFAEAATVGNRRRVVSQSYRPAPCEWPNGPRSRNSSQRGCTVSVDTGRSARGTDRHREFDDPEAWSPILARGARGGVHARTTPEDLRYTVRFGFSRDEYRRASADAYLMDTPVFDDISITYMRRPKVLLWRDVSE